MFALHCTNYSFLVLIPFRLLDPEVIFGLALLGIWRSHWLFVFNDIPFVAFPVTENICRSISIAVQENCVKQGQAHRALLFFSID